jgi:hypothetical protein
VTSLPFNPLNPPGTRSARARMRRRTLGNDHRLYRSAEYLGVDNFERSLPIASFSAPCHVQDLGPRFYHRNLGRLVLRLPRVWEFARSRDPQANRVGTGARGALQVPFQSRSEPRSETGTPRCHQGGWCTSTLAYGDNFQRLSRETLSISQASRQRRGQSTRAHSKRVSRISDQVTATPGQPSKHS